MKYLGVDPGGRRFGLALGDDRTGLVVPAGIHPYHGVETTAAWLKSEAQKRDAEIIVLGLPTSEDGEETPACRRTRALAEALAGCGSDIVLQPEFLSTHAARSRARDLGRPRGAPVDDLAAQVILEDYLAAAAAITAS
ncbi:MAG: Holliday junction resolvase RuvX [Acidobacteriota bacterium]